MKILVKTIDAREVKLDVEPSTTVLKVKQELERVVHVPVDKQRLIFQGRVLQNDKQLKDYNIQDGHALHLVSVEPLSGQRPEPSQPLPQPQTNTQTRTTATIRTATLNDGALTNLLGNALGQLRSATAPQAPQGNSAPATQISSQYDQVLNLQDSIQGQLTELSNLLRGNQLNNTQRQRARQLTQQISPTLSNISSRYQQLNTMVQNLNLPQSGQITTSQHLPSVQNINVHVHATVDELDDLPNRLTALQQRLNVQNRPRIQHRQFNLNPGNGNAQNATITIIGDNQGPPTSLLNRISGRQQNQQQPSRPQQQPPQRPPQPPQQNAQQNQQNPANMIMSAVGNLLGSLNTNSGGSSSNNNNNPGFNLGNLMQNFGNLANVAANQQRNQSNSSSNNATGTVTRTTTQQPAQRQPVPSSSAPERRSASPAGSSVSGQSVGSVIHNLSRQMGLSEEPENQFEELLEIFFDHVEMAEMMVMLNGDMSVMDKAMPELRKHLCEKILKGDTSQQNREQLVEDAIAYCLKTTKDVEEMNTLLDQCVEEGQIEHFYDQFGGLMRTYLTILVDLIVDGPEKLKSPYLPPVSKKEVGPIFWPILQIIIGESTIILENNLTNGTSDRERVLKILFEKLIFAMPQMEQLGALGQLGSIMMMNFWNKQYEAFKNQYPTRIPVITPHHFRTARRTVTTEEPPHQPMEDEPDTPTDSGDNQTFGEKPADDSKKQESPQGFPFQLNNFLQGMSQEQPKQPTQTSQPEDPENWRIGLSEGEQKMIESTIKEDLIEMSLAGEGKQQLSTTYQSDTKPNEMQLSKEQQQDDDEPEVTKEKTGSSEDEEDYDLD